MLMFTTCILVLVLLFHPTCSFTRNLQHVAYWRLNGFFSVSGSQVSVDFFPSGKQTAAEIGERIDDVAVRAGVEIPYKCRKGECGTCEVNMDGKWVKACQSTIPARNQVSIIIRSEKATLDKTQATAEFFTPKSFLEGIINNGLGLVGFLKVGIVKANEEYDQRMRKEKELTEKVAAKKAAREAKK